MDDANRLLGVTDCHRGDHVHSACRHAFDLERVVFGCRFGGHHRVDAIAVSAGAHRSTDQERTLTRPAVPNGGHDIDRRRNQLGQRRTVMAEGRRPIGVGPPCRRLEDDRRAD